MQFDYEAIDIDAQKEITPAMLKAGLEALALRRDEFPEQTVARIYLAMLQKHEN